MINIKNIGILLLALAIAGVIIYAKPEQPIGAELVLLEVQKLDTINTFQTQELSKGHYKHVPRTYTKDNDYRVDEYLSPNGDIGYTVILFKDVNGVESSKVIDYGSEGRSVDWTHLIKTATST